MSEIALFAVGYSARHRGCSIWCLGATSIELAAACTIFEGGEKPSDVSAGQKLISLSKLTRRFKTAGEYSGKQAQK